MTSATADPSRSGARLDRGAVEAVDGERLVRDVEAQGHQLEDALWRVESAGIPRAERRGGLIVCGMGGSAIGGDLAAAAIGERARGPIRIARGYRLPSGLGGAEPPLVLCASYSGDTEETFAAFEAAGEARAERIALTTGGRLAAVAREQGVPVIGVPAGLQPRAAVAYMVVAVLECAALCGAAPSLRGELEAARRLLDGLATEWGPDGPEDSLPKEVARRLDRSIPVVYGIEASAPVALRWKTQLNENAKLPAYWGALPEANHNELAGWEGAPELGPFAAVFLDDAGADERTRRRIRPTMDEVGRFASDVIEVESVGDSPLERVTAGVMLGDLVSVYLAVLRGVDPTPVEAIERLKRAIGDGGEAPPDEPDRVS